MFWDFFLRDALRARRSAAASSANPANAPITIPAIAPPLSLFDPASTAFVCAGLADEETDVCEGVEVAVAVALELATLEDMLPKTWFKRTTPAPESQQSVS